MKKMYFFLIRNIPRKYLILFSYVFRWFSSIVYAGNKVECPVCEKKFRKFLPYGVWENRENALCPNCLSLERHRLMWLFLKNKTSFFSDQLKVLHVAPEQCFLNRFKKLKNLDYTTADIESPIADVKMDVQDMPFEDNSFDVVFCNHVLEHVEDDKKAMREILRVLKKDGFAILYVPNDFSRKATYEDPTINDPLEREKHFRQKDHVRLYGNDYPEVLKSVGFEIREENYAETVDTELKERCKLPEKEFLYAYFKP